MSYQPPEFTQEQIAEHAEAQQREMERDERPSHRWLDAPFSLRDPKETLADDALWAPRKYNYATGQFEPWPILSPSHPSSNGMD